MELKNKLLLIIGMVWPEPESSAAGTRMLQLILLFQKQGFDIVFASAAQESAFSYNLNSIGVNSEKITLNSSSFDLFVKNLNPNIVIFDRFVTEEQFSWRVFENSPSSIRIIDTEDLHCLRLVRQHAVKKKIPFLLSDLLDSDIAKREIASILRCDLSLIISEFEMSVLEKIFKIDPVLLHYLPLFDTPKIQETLPSFEDRKDFVFIGNFLHEPNWDAVKQLKETIWPLIKKQLPEAKMHVFGAYTSQKVLQLHNETENFLVHGRVISVDLVLNQARVLLAPLRFGAGLKGKLINAMQVATPSVTTSIGAEGINSNYEWSGFIEDEMIDFSTKAILLYQDKKIWEESQINGLKILKNRFKKELFEGQFIKKIELLFHDVVLHRKQNFIGSLLFHHLNLSTKYMSRWIEEKNK
jgi:glycosyltransferase involved in cell wall biosynthesis